jgi:HAD superfamily hydrolase (TIGR01509 family)
MNISTYIKTVIFDMDGLLIDSEQYWYQTTETFFTKYNKPFHQSVHMQIRGKSMHDIIAYFKREYGFVGDTEELIAERKRMLYELLLHKVQLMDGASALIQALHHRGIPLAIATAAHKREMAEQMLTKMGVRSLFSVILCGEDVKKNKPAPDIYLQTAKLLHVDPKVCLVLEDTATGVVAGKSAGMTVFGVNSDEAFHEGLKNAGADKILKSLSEIQV